VLPQVDTGGASVVGLQNLFSIVQVAMGGGTAASTGRGIAREASEAIPLSRAAQAKSAQAESVVTAARASVGEQDRTRA
jgi:hypothetical protein